ncbi:serine/threonine protein kinase [Thecamonas trahens ATCC 50062]|uniref:Serine/threonine protein kinase n=1 Tax=Thecamonas trahens ATCC 50062 TaxID=461836 RepID=A0A0L0D4X0_THETB|nr:serine/threonine protein kinase [Thecamonas trahens ATCC 50062]KNC47106.1 serine/threonine protein kinase [Thecamonas trahens ATCC 50062]|eukprot:XP_013759883.1 serine/threonine protein kinase [Thecamonas trahens ATCC 50062]
MDRYEVVREVGSGQWVARLRPGASLSGATGVVDATAPSAPSAASGLYIVRATPLPRSMDEAQRERLDALLFAQFKGFIHAAEMFVASPPPPDKTVAPADPPAPALYAVAPTGSTTLRDLVRTQGGPLAPELVRHIARGLVDILVCMHEMGHAVGNLAADTVYLDLAALRSSSGQRSPVRIAPFSPLDVGVPSALARTPERLLGVTTPHPGHDLNLAADAWALGVVLAEMLLGGPLFDSETVASVPQHLYQVFKVIGAPGTPSDLPYLAPEHFDALVSALPKTTVGWPALLPDAPSDVLTLLDALFALDPRRRITMVDAVAHRYFHLPLSPGIEPVPLLDRSPPPPAPTASDHSALLDETLSLLPLLRELSPNPPTRLHPPADDASSLASSLDKLDAELEALQNRSSSHSSNSRSSQQDLPSLKPPSPFKPTRQPRQSPSIISSPSPSPLPSPDVSFENKYLTSQVDDAASQSWADDYEYEYQYVDDNDDNDDNNSHHSPIQGGKADGDEAVVNNPSFALVPSIPFPGCPDFATAGKPADMPRDSRHARPPQAAVAIPVQASLESQLSQLMAQVKHQQLHLDELVSTPSRTSPCSASEHQALASPPVATAVQEPASSQPWHSTRDIAPPPDSLGTRARSEANGLLVDISRGLHFESALINSCRASGSSWFIAYRLCGEDQPVVSAMTSPCAGPHFDHRVTFALSHDQLRQVVVGASNSASAPLTVMLCATAPSTPQARTVLAVTDLDLSPLAYGLASLDGWYHALDESASPALNRSLFSQYLDQYSVSTPPPSAILADPSSLAYRLGGISSYRVDPLIHASPSARHGLATSDYVSSPSGPATAGLSSAPQSGDGHHSEIRALQRLQASLRQLQL